MPLSAAAYKTTSPKVTAKLARCLRTVKQVIGLQSKSTEPLVDLAQRLHDESINKFFQQVAADLCPLSEPTTLPFFNLPLNEFTTDQSAVERTLSHISIYKAPGPDGLPNWITGTFAPPPALGTGLWYLQRFDLRRHRASSIERGQCDSGAESSSASADRSRSLTNLADSAVQQAVRIFPGWWILDRIEDKHQYGALRRRSTTHSLVDIIHHWHKAVDESKSVRAVFVDFAKAFMLTTTSW